MKRPPHAGGRSNGTRWRWRWVGVRFQTADSAAHCAGVELAFGSAASNCQLDCSRFTDQPGTCLCFFQRDRRAACCLLDAGCLPTDKPDSRAARVLLGKAESVAPLKPLQRHRARCTSTSAAVSIVGLACAVLTLTRDRFIPGRSWITV